MSLEALKKNRSNLMKNLESAINTAEKKGGYENPNVWKPTLNKETETGYARIRFLPPPEGEDLPFVKIVKNSIKSPTGKYYVNESRRTIGEPDPFNEMVSRVYNSGVKSDEVYFKNTLEGRSQKVYYANVLVLEDPANKAVEGKVMIYAFGQKIMEAITLKNKPQFADETPANAFDMWEGCDFTIKARRSDGQWTYDKSSWGPVCELFSGDDKKKESTWKQTHKLQEFLDPKNFKPYEELAAKLLEVLGPEIGSGIPVVIGSPQQKPAKQFTETRKPSYVTDLNDDEQEAALIAVETRSVPVRVEPRGKVTTVVEDDASFFDDFDK